MRQPKDRENLLFQVQLTIIQAVPISSFDQHLSLETVRTITASFLSISYTVRTVQTSNKCIEISLEMCDCNLKLYDLH